MAIPMDPLKKVLLILSTKKKEMHVLWLSRTSAWGGLLKGSLEGCGRYRVMPPYIGIAYLLGAYLELCGIQDSTCKKLCGLNLSLHWLVQMLPSKRQVVSRTLHWPYTLLFEYPLL